ncbi:MAG: helix-turn-helix domain-containing protein [Halovenus sp.]
MGDSPVVESADPEEVLSALSDSTRVDILRALWDPDRETVPFSELRDAVRVRDSGKFNYHLDKLTDRFVRKTDEGYELTTDGPDEQEETGESEPFPMVQYECRRCGQDLWIDLANALVMRPAVAAREIPPWRFTVFDTDQARIVDRDPLRAHVGYPCDDERLDLVVDENLEVQRVERHTG